MVHSPPYCGRFAPSPTGPLHFGSLVAALGSYLEAKSQGGRWLLRMEDLDKPREMPGAADGILRILEAYGFEWDGALLYQSRRQEAYRNALDQLRRQEAVYFCACTRREIADSSLAGAEGPIYPGTCRMGLAAEREPRTVRVRVEGTVSFQDRLQGRFTQDLEREVGDFVLYRADGIFAYQLAVVVDDAEQGVTEVVRGSDLLASTPRQIYLQRLLGLPQPEYLHLPVVLNPAGEKLSKQTLAPALESHAVVATLCQGLTFLGQQPPPELLQADLASLWRWALDNWRTQRIPVKGCRN